MKKIFLSFAALTAILCTSCNKDNESISITPNNNESEDMSILFALNTNAVETRAFFDNSASLEAWEKQLNKASIMAINVQSGSVIARRDLTSSEMLSGKVTMSSPNFTEGEYLAIIAIANLDVSQDFSSLLDFVNVASDFSISECNGTFSEVAYGSKREDGFIMDADGGITLSSDNNYCDLTLKTPVAKVAMKLSVSDSFSTNYAGDLRVNSVTVSNTPMKINEDGTLFTHTQTSVLSSGQYQNLFYVLPSSPTFTINATYDADGNFSTTTDQREVVYTLVLEDDYGDPITLSRHSYYRISGTIVGLDSAAASTNITFTVSDWGSIESFDVEV